MAETKVENSFDPTHYTNVAHTEQMTDAWVPHRTECWELCDVARTTLTEVIVIQGDQEVAFERTAVHAFDPSHDEDLEDLSQMNNLHEAPFLHAILRRYREEKIYTYTGDVLISVNPYKTIPFLYDIKGSSMQACRRASKDLSLEEAAKRDAERQKETRPHVFSIADRAFRYMSHPDDEVQQGRARLRNQSVIVSGESGAGKTEASKYVMRYLIAASQQLALQRSSSMEKGRAEADRQAELGRAIQAVLLDSNYVLEAFGNAKTVRNDNSSRFGKYIMLQYDDSSRLVGACTDHFLLEKSRLVSAGQDERNYHIFYELCAGIDFELRGELRIEEEDGCRAFRMLTQGNCTELSDEVDEQSMFSEVQNALTTMGVTADEMRLLWRLVATILHMGNMTFVAAGSTVRAACLSMPLDMISANLEVRGDDFQTRLINRFAQSGKGEVFTIPLTAEQAQGNLTALIKWVYGRLFTWIVRKVNQAHSAVASAEHAVVQSFIGILDIFGFELLKKNSFEQLCINYANEVLQQQFNDHVFISEQEMYRSEGLDWTDIPFRNNQNVIDLLSKRPFGLFIILEEHSFLNRKPDNKALLQTFHNTHSNKHECYSKPRFLGDDFIVKHFAGDVTYDSTGFIEKNNDSLQEDLLRMIAESTSAFMQNILDVNPVEGAPGYIPMEAVLRLVRSVSIDSSDNVRLNTDHDEKKEPASNSKSNVSTFRKLTSMVSGATDKPAASASTPNRAGPGTFASMVSISSQFREQLKVLVDTLRSTEPHYIKCIKPNNIKAPGAFSNNLVIQQLRYCGALEVVRIRRDAFPISIKFREFYRSFLILAHGKGWKSVDDASDEEILAYVNKLAKDNLDGNGFRVGHTKIFLRDYGLEKMRLAVKTFFDRRAARIQSMVRGVWQRRIYIKMKKASIIMQTSIRMKLGVLRFKKAMKRVLKIQSVLDGKFLRSRFAKKKKAIVVMQKHVRRMICRLKYTVEGKRHRAAKEIQRVMKGHKARRLYYRLRMALRIQKNYRGLLSRRWYKNEKKRFFKAVTLLTAFIRMRKARRVFAVKKRKYILVQAVVRGYYARCKFMTLQTQDRLRRQLEKKKATMLQSVARSHLARLEYKKARKSASRIASVGRMICARNEYEKNRKSIILLQSLQRMRIVRKSFRISIRCACRIQAKIRCLLQKARYRLQRKACLRLQVAIHRASLNIMHRKRLLHMHQLAKEGRAIGLADFLKLYPSYAVLRNKWDGFKTLLHSAILSGEMSVVQFLNPTIEDMFMRDTEGNISSHFISRVVSLSMFKFFGDRLTTTFGAEDSSSPQSSYQHAKSNMENRKAQRAATKAKRKSIAVMAEVPHTSKAGLTQAGALSKENADRDRDSDRKSNTPMTVTSIMSRFFGSAQSTLEASGSDDDKSGDEGDGPESKTAEKILKEGFVKKRRDGARFQKRWLVISDKELRYLKKQKDRTARRAVSIASCLFKRSDAIEFGFEIRSPELLSKADNQGKLHFQCASEMELQSWLAPLRLLTRSNQSNVSYTYRDNSLRQEFVQAMNKYAETPLHQLASFGIRMTTAQAKPVQSSSKRVLQSMESTIVSGSLLSSSSSRDGTRKVPMSHIMQVALWLLEAGCPLESQNSMGDTAMHITARNNSADFLAVLQKRGCDMMIRNNDGRSVMDLASTDVVAKLAVGRFKAGEHFALLKSVGNILPLCTYLSLAIEKVTMQSAEALENPFLSISVLTRASNLVEEKQDVEFCYLRKREYLWWGSTYHMQTPLENVDFANTCIIVELKDCKVKKGKVLEEEVAWVAYRLDPARLSLAEFNLEMLPFPLDLGIVFNAANSAASTTPTVTSPNAAGTNAGQTTTSPVTSVVDCFLSGENFVMRGGAPTTEGVKGL